MSDTENLIAITCDQCAGHGCDFCANAGTVEMLQAWRVESEQGLEQIFMSKDAAEKYADELTDKLGAKTAVIATRCRNAMANMMSTHNGSLTRITGTRPVCEVCRNESGEVARIARKLLLPDGRESWIDVCATCLQLALAILSPKPEGPHVEPGSLQRLRESLKPRPDATPEQANLLSALAQKLGL